MFIFDIAMKINNFVDSHPKLMGVIVILCGLSLCFIEVEPGIHDITFMPVFVALGLYSIFAKDPYGKNKNNRY
jgi:hypothetical protein